VVPPTKILEALLTRRGWDCQYIVQSKANGVPDAILQAAEKVKELALVVFGDNIYDYMEFTGTRAATVHHLAYTGHLDRHCGEWLERPGMGPYFSGTILCWKSDLRWLASRTLLEWLNYICMPAELRVEDKWSDLGTVETYYEYIVSE
jgi:hypothetical protein